jgi:hypothetical protein
LSRLSELTSLEIVGEGGSIEVDQYFFDSLFIECGQSHGHAGWVVLNEEQARLVHDWLGRWLAAKGSE